jgi:hypothetical protein
MAGDVAPPEPTPAEVEAEEAWLEQRWRQSAPAGVRARAAARRATRRLVSWLAKIARTSRP